MCFINSNLFLFLFMFSFKHRVSFCINYVCLVSKLFPVQSVLELIMKWTLQWLPHSSGPKPSVWFSWYHLWPLPCSFLDVFWCNTHRQGCNKDAYSGKRSCTYITDVRISYKFRICTCRGYYMPARRYEFYLREFNSISHEFAQIKWEGVVFMILVWFLLLCLTHDVFFFFSENICYLSI